MTPWPDAAAAAWLFAVDPAGTGMVLRAPAGPARDRWLALLRAALPDGMRRVPLGIADDRLDGGLDLAATLAAGRPVATRGLLSEGGVLLLAMAERMKPALAARLACEDGRVALVALDEGAAPEEAAPAVLRERLAFHVALGEDVTETAAPDIAAARALLPAVQVAPALLDALCGAAAALGIASLRAPLLALRAARAAAALAGRGAVAEEDVALAARLVLAPRATALPDAAPAPPAAAEPDPLPDAADREEGAEQERAGAVEDRVVAAAQAAIPAGLLETVQARAAGMARTAGPSGAVHRAGQRGRPAGVRAGDPRAGLRLNLLETLRAAAPWQGVRGRAGGRVQVRRSDFRVTTLRQRAETTTVFVVDASGSAALNRLAEAKGAVELLLAECYVRRDRVAVLAFRGPGAQLLLPPTRSLVRAKRSLAGLPGGGGTPLAAGIDAGAALAADVRRRGGTPTLVLLTDGRANVALDGKGNRAVAQADAAAAARRLRGAGLSALLVDTSPRPHAPTRTLAAEMGARYVALPFADSAALSQVVREAV